MSTRKPTTMTKQRFEIVFSAASQTAPWYESYLGKRISLPTGTSFQLDEEACMRAAVKYGSAIARALKLGDYIRSVNEAAGRDYEIELSVDENRPAHHLGRTLHHRRSVSSGH